MKRFLKKSRKSLQYKKDGNEKWQVVRYSQLSYAANVPSLLHGTQPQYSQNLFPMKKKSV